MLATKNTYIESAYKTLQVISQDREKRWEYEAREKALHDYNQGMLEAEERGRLEGWEEGRLEGREEGRLAEKENNAKNMLAVGLSHDLVAQITGLSPEKIEQISKEEQPT